MLFRSCKMAMIALPVPKVSETREQDYIVCLEERCIFDWLYFNRTCPVCLFVFPYEK